MYEDDKGHSPLIIAIMSKKYLKFTDSDCADVALYLMNHGCTCSDEDKAKLLCKTCSCGASLDVVKELVEQHKVDPSGEHYYMYMTVYCTIFQLVILANT